METPPRFTPDNSEEARATRIASTSDVSYDHALAWIRLRLKSFEEPKNTSETQYDELPPD